MIVMFVLIVLPPLWRTATVNPEDYEAIIERAVRQQDPMLCEEVRATTRPGETDGQVKIIGQDAVDWCKQQVRAGKRIIGG